MSSPGEITFSRLVPCLSFVLKRLDNSSIVQHSRRCIQNHSENMSRRFLPELSHCWTVIAIFQYGTLTCYKYCFHNKNGSSFFVELATASRQLKWITDLRFLRWCHAITCYSKRASVINTLLFSFLLIPCFLFPGKSFKSRI